MSWPARFYRGARWLVPCLGLLAVGCGDQRESPANANTQPVSVRVVQAQPVEHAAEFPAAGVVRPYRRVEMGTRQAGMVVDVLVQAGDRVEAGQEILRVDSRDLEASRSATLLQREAAHEAREQALRNRDRFRRLYEQELVAKVRLEEAELQAERADSAFGRANAELAAIEINMDYTRLRAPFAGVVSEILAETGSFVVPGVPLVVFEDRDRLEIEAGVDQASAADLSPGTRLPVTVEGIDAPLRGRLQAVLPALADPGTGLRLRVVIDDPPAELTPGMVAELRLPSARRAEQRIRVPATALVRRGQLTGVFVAEPGEDGSWQAHLRWIALDPEARETDWVYVKRGLEAGEQIVSGMATRDLSDGQTVVLED